jgi:very-short-patch-repair endonuclease
MRQDCVSFDEQRGCMRYAPCGSSPALATLPRVAVVRVAGPSVEQLIVNLDPLPPDAPVVIRCIISAALRASALVTDLLSRLETVAMQLFPAWLPDGDTVTTTSGLDRRAVRILARRHAANSEHFGPFLADAAEAALLGVSRVERFPPEIRARGLVRILADAYDREGVVVLIVGSAELDEAQQRTAAVAFSWLANHGIGVWLTDGMVPCVDRFPAEVIAIPSYVGPTEPPPQPAVTVVDFPAPLGLPHPLSEAEQRLAHALARCEWAGGYQWNQERNEHSLMPTIRVDLIWPTERCIVEIDGPDHRGPQKYAADRVRDNALTLEGFRVLRFTNDQIVDEMSSVLHVIKTMLSKLRLHEGTSS